jgi:hypothetical protein
VRYAVCLGCARRVVHVAVIATLNEFAPSQSPPGEEVLQILTLGTSRHCHGWMRSLWYPCGEAFKVLLFCGYCMHQAHGGIDQLCTWLVQTVLFEGISLSVLVAHDGINILINASPS